MPISETKMKIVIDNYFKVECDINTSIREAFEKGFRIGVQKGYEVTKEHGEWIDEGFYADGHSAHAFRCSECGGHIIEYDVDPFCRWCGARMEMRNNE